MASESGEVLTYSSRRSHQVIVCPVCPERPYVQLKLPEAVGRVKKIVFKTVSHDQGKLPTLQLPQGLMRWIVAGAYPSLRESPRPNASGLLD